MFHTFQALCVSIALGLSNARSIRGAVKDRKLVIGGTVAEKARYPYMVSLQTELSHFCGASLIARDVLISAAHCDISFDYFAVVGRHHWMDEDVGERLEIAQSVQHPDYSFEDEDNDIMLLFLSNVTADNIPLVKLNSDSLMPETNSPVTVMGWGDTAIDDYVFEMSDILKIAKLSIQSNEKCEKSKGAYLDGRASYKEEITDSMICAEEEGIDSCQTDSGKITSLVMKMTRFD